MFAAAAGEYRWASYSAGSALAMTSAFVAVRRGIRRYAAPCQARRCLSAHLGHGRVRMAERTVASHFDRRPAVPNKVAPSHNTPVSRFAPKRGAPRVASETPELECDEGGPPRWQAPLCHRRASSRRPVYMLHAGLDLSRKRLDVCLLSDDGELVEEFSAPPDADGLRGLVRHVAAAWRARARGDRVDDRRPLRSRHAGAAWLGGSDRRRAEGQGVGAAGMQDRQDRRARPGGAL